MGLRWELSRLTITRKLWLLAVVATVFYLLHIADRERPHLGRMIMNEDDADERRENVNDNVVVEHQVKISDDDGNISDGRKANGNTAGERYVDTDFSSHDYYAADGIGDVGQINSKVNKLPEKNNTPPRKHTHKDNFKGGRTTADTINPRNKLRKGGLIKPRYIATHGKDTAKDIKPVINKEDIAVAEGNNIKWEDKKSGERTENEKAEESTPTLQVPDHGFHNNLIFHGFYSINETSKDHPIMKVLLLTYQRAGSSYTGELLTSGGEAMYVFEPFFVWRKLLGPKADPRLEADSAKALGDLLDCRPEVIRFWRRKNYYYFRRKPEGIRNFCPSARLRLVKTIRARARFIMPWITARPDIKVIHLVRDPRGILSSVRQGGHLWSDNSRNVALQCDNLKNDLQLADLGPSRYLRVRYEDLVDHPIQELNRVFRFMGTRPNNKVMTYLKLHSGLDQSPALKQDRYLNTYRDARYRHDHWKTHLKQRELEHIQKACADVMARLGYTPLPPA